ncbi:hypothetical protein CSUI_009246 [Cystoisospora suis]|uniref:Uncharacterized protein n=1 Tax=Cystoisospora suis TaxID=483139 RepID=A0A2C6KHB3_9APIC|nr:hypothetical protein CSUI_009246 [Cystoisospora suis]
MTAGTSRIVVRYSLQSLLPPSTAFVPISEEPLTAFTWTRALFRPPTLSCEHRESLSYCRVWCTEEDVPYKARSRLRRWHLRRQICGKASSGFRRRSPKRSRIVALLEPDSWWVRRTRVPPPQVPQRRHHRPCRTRRNQLHRSETVHPRRCHRLIDFCGVAATASLSTLPKHFCFRCPLFSDADPVYTFPCLNPYVEPFSLNVATVPPLG